MKHFELFLISNENSKKQYNCDFLIKNISKCSTQRTTECLKYLKLFEKKCKTKQNN